MQMSSFYSRDLIVCDEAKDKTGRHFRLLWQVWKLRGVLLKLIVSMVGISG